MPQTWTAQSYEQEGRFVADLAEPLLELLAPQPGERILDLGCGDGFLTARIRLAGAAVVAVDTSSALLQAARERGIDARLGDGQQLTFTSEFDAVFSNAALHWMSNQDAVLNGVRTALRPGGRFVAEMGGHGNVAAIRTALRVIFGSFEIDAEMKSGNFFFTSDEYRNLLERHGFAISSIALLPRPTPLPTGIAGWLRTFRRSLLDTLDAQQQLEVIASVEKLLKPVLCDSFGQWHADYVRLRFLASAP